MKISVVWKGKRDGAFQLNWRIVIDAAVYIISNRKSEEKEYRNDWKIVWKNEHKNMMEIRQQNRVMLETKCTNQHTIY